MSIKTLVRRFNILNCLAVLIKGQWDENRARRLCRFYHAQADRNGLSIPEGDKLKAMLYQRLISRNLYPVAKTKGNLHIFLAFPLANWETIFPLVLRPFGRVTVFEWRSLGFNDRSSRWLKQRDSMNQEMLETFIKAHNEQPIDGVVGYLSGYNTNPKTLMEMARRGSVIYNFCLDDKLGFPGPLIGGRYRSPAALASAVDLNLTSSPDSIIKYMVHGGVAMFWPEAAHPDIHKPYDVPFEFDVSFVGQRYGYRLKFIDTLRKIGINVVTFGKGWKNGTLSGDEIIKVYSRSRINLGFGYVGYSRKIVHLKARDFEVPMSGGLYLTTNNPELGIVYKIGKEIITFEDETDCAKKIRWLLNNPEDAEMIRKAGRRRALDEHTWEKRFTQIFKLAGLLKP